MTKHPAILIARASLVGVGIALLLVGIVMLLSNCATLQSAVPTVTELAVLECRHYVDTHPDQNIPQSLCDNAGNLWLDVVTLVDAKPNVAAVKESLVAHPPLSSAAALALPCLDPKLDLKNPYEEPQSRIERKLYPYVTTPPVPGE